MEELSEKERIEDYAKELNISVIKDELDDFITLGTEQNWTYRTLLCQLLSKEVCIIRSIATQYFSPNSLLTTRN